MNQFILRRQVVVRFMLSEVFFVSRLVRILRNYQKLNPFGINLLSNEEIRLNFSLKKY